MWQTVTRRIAGHRGSESEPEGPRRARDLRLEFRLPSPYGGPAWISATLAASSVPATQGETIRIRAHLNSCFRMPEQTADRSALSHDDGPGAGGLVHRGRSLAARAARGAIERVPRRVMQRLAEQRRRSWLDMQISTSPLDGGAAALMPAALRERYGDTLPRVAPGAPRVGVWHGPAGGPLGGVARLAMVQFDDRDRAQDDARERNDRFSLNLTIGDLIEPAGAVPDTER